MFYVAHPTTQTEFSLLGLSLFTLGFYPYFAGKLFLLPPDLLHGSNLILSERMSSYDNVVGGKLKLKGKALDVKAGGMKKKKSKKHDQSFQNIEHSLSEGQLTDPNKEDEHDPTKLNQEGSTGHIDDALTPAEKRYIEQRERIDSHRLAKISNKSHRDRIQDFNQYLANMSEHYDIPKVGPG